MGTQNLTAAVNSQKDMWSRLHRYIACKEAIEDAISRNFSDYCLHSALALQETSDQFARDEILTVLAISIQEKVWDARFSKDNIQWAQEYAAAALEKMTPMEQKHSCLLTITRTHSVLLDAFISTARKLPPSPAKN